jgi:hypothetical protein
MSRRNWATHEGGDQLLQWVGVGATIAVLLAGLYSALIDNAALRAGVTRTVEFYAVRFGDDIVARGPGLPGGLLLPGADLRTTVDPTTGAFTIVDLATGTRYTVQPGEGMQVTTDPTTGQITLSDAARDYTVLITPAMNQAALIDHTTGVRRPASLAELDELQVVQVANDRLAP